MLSSECLPYEFYKDIRDLFRKILVSVYANLQRILKSMSRGVVTLTRKDPSKGNYIKTFRSITLLNIKVKILAKVFAKRVRFVVGGRYRHVPSQVG